MVLNIHCLCLGTSWASELQGSSTSSFYESDMSAFGEYSTCPLFFSTFIAYFRCFCDFNIAFVYLGTPWASEPQESSVSIFHRSDFGEYPACELFYGLFGLFSMFFVILILPLCI